MQKCNLMKIVARVVNTSKKKTEKIQLKKFKISIMHLAFRKS